ncbi:unnamed protein product, partial [Sphenostylis stenocarpa]
SGFHLQPNLPSSLPFPTRTQLEGQYCQSYKFNKQCSSIRIATKFFSEENRCS